LGAVPYRMIFQEGADQEIRAARHLSGGLREAP
jgi:hypothetical protein